MHGLVRDLYKRFVFVGRDYPLGVQFVKRKVKAAFRKNAHLTDDRDIRKAVHYGRYAVKELIGVIQLKKYRTMSKRYGPPPAQES